ncbi:MAG TPA: methylthioribulose 1-phosphate dehydratase [Vicinamibacterales bacterium]|nr:methylthioribulose 1-phosphate dehydratase [Vicinamibacterales bacterium]
MSHSAGPPLPTFREAASRLSDIGRRFYDRGWVMGTSGNFSAVVSRRPLKLAITSSAAHKGRLAAAQFLQIDAQGSVMGPQARPRSNGAARPSAETRLHLEIVDFRGAGAVLHTHSVWSTILSDRHAKAKGLAIEQFEMLKGLDGVVSHEHREWIPIVPNDQDMTRLARAVRQALSDHPSAHAFLLERHGLYTWGATLDEAERHVEILEFLLEVSGRK